MPLMSWPPRHSTANSRERHDERPYTNLARDTGYRSLAVCVICNILNKRKEVSNDKTIE
jgi:hypothetical protein